MTLTSSHRISHRHLALAAALACVLALSCVLLAGCGSDGAKETSGTSSSAESSSASSSATESASSSQTVSFTDDLGRSVEVPKKPKRVVAGMGSFADMWQLAGGTLVGATDEAFADYGIDKDKVSSIGGFSSINQETLLALNPNFVILTGTTEGQAGTADQTQLADALEAAGVPVAYFKVTTFDDYLRVLRTMCDITGRDDLYKKNGTQVKKRIGNAIEKYGAAAKGKKVMVGVSYSQGVRVLRSDSQTGTMLADLGATNIADENQSLLEDFSTEALLDIDPDYIFIIPMGTSEAATKSSLENLTSDTSWKSLTAVKKGHFFTLDPDLYMYKPNNKWDKAYVQLGKDFLK
ncbi:MAG: ABC transporter substrate-binding protein [Eggerthellaceae bacterium]|jgi:iron complex transport system substrate-binding protein